MPSFWSIACATHTGFYDHVIRRALTILGFLPFLEFVFFYWRTNYVHFWVGAIVLTNNLIPSIFPNHRFLQHSIVKCFDPCLLSHRHMPKFICPYLCAICLSIRLGSYNYGWQLTIGNPIDPHGEKYVSKQTSEDTGYNDHYQPLSNSPYGNSLR